MVKDTSIDTGYIVLGTHTIAVEQEGGHIAFVQASRRCFYDARLHEATVTEHLRLLELAHMRAQPDSGSKWCCHCGDTRGKSYFYADSRNRDGLDSWCSACRKKQQRDRRELQAVAEGRTLRAYHRKQADVIEVDFAPSVVRKAA